MSPLPLRVNRRPPGQHQSWIFPADPRFAERAGPVLDLYERRWEGELLHPGDYVICADEKTQIQARAGVHASSPPAPGQMMRVEHEYERCGALSYLAAWDVHHGRLFGRCEATTGIVPFGRLVEQVMSQAPYKDAQRVFWIVDNRSSHRGEASRKRLQTAWPNLIVVHTPVHARRADRSAVHGAGANARARQSPRPCRRTRSKRICAPPPRTI